MLPKGTDAAPLRVLLHHTRRRLDQLTHGLNVTVRAQIGLRGLSGSFDCEEEEEERVCV